MATVDLTVANFLCKNMHLGGVYIFRGFVHKCG